MFRNVHALLLAACARASTSGIEMPECTNRGTLATMTGLISVPISELRTFNLKNFLLFMYAFLQFM
jgi:hypothetical protein